jgi:hypothetical protein
MTVQDVGDGPDTAMPVDLAIHEPALVDASGLGAGPASAPGDEAGVSAAEGASEESGRGAIIVPSGQQVILHDVVRDAPGPEGAALRFRFLAPAIARVGGTVDVDQATADMAYLCKTYAIQRATGVVPVPTQIIISMSDMAVPFGQPAPEATQYFEAYRIVNGTCVWEGF